MNSPTRLALASLALAACLAPPVGTPENSVEEVVPVAVEQGYRNEVDLLFVIDNSNSMQAKQDELKRRFPALIGELDKLAGSGKPANYHIGVVTSDLGSNSYTDGSCTPGGDQFGGGRLRAIGEAADPRCGATQDGRPYLVVNQLDGTNNLSTPPAGEGADALAWAFGCMAAVGDKGCGFEQHLEAAYTALRSTDNQGFLRPDALLVVVIVADEDDCSAPSTSDVYDAATFGVRASFRCPQYGWVCDGQLLPYAATTAPYTECHPATAADGGKLHAMQRYVDFFTKPDGVKKDPVRQVIVTAIVADPGDGVEVMQGKKTVDATGQFEPCSGPLSLDCSYKLKKSCIAASDPAMSGEPAVRLAALVNAVPQHELTSICADDYTPALKKIADLIGVNLEPGCVRGVLEDPEHPDCEVEEINGSARASLPFCGSGVPTPCWKVVDNAQCGYQHKALAIDRGGALPPIDSHTEASCVTLAQLPADMKPATTPGN